MKGIFIAILFVLFALASYGASFESNEHTFGDPINGGDLILRSSNGGYLKKVDGGGWKKSDDGVSETDIGAGGSGGGANYNNAFTSSDNANAESSTTGWTASAGDFFVTSSVSDWVTATSYSIGDKVVESGIIYKANTAHTSGTFATDIANWDEIAGADALESSASFVWAPSLQNDYVQGPLIDMNKDVFKHRACQVRIEYIGGDENLELKLFDLGGVEYPTSGGTISTGTISSGASAFFRCPSKNEITGNSNLAQLRVRIVNTGASVSAPVKWDKSYIGTLIGLSETTLPDVVTVSFFQGTINDDGGVVDSISWTNSSNPTTVTFKAGIYTVEPNVACQFNSGNATGVSNRSVTVYDKTQSGFKFSLRNLSDIETNAYTIECFISKSGVDKKQAIQTYKAIPKVSENINDFSARVSCVASSSITDENVTGWTSSVTNIAGGACTVSFNTSTFNNKPNCSILGNANGQIRFGTFTDDSLQLVCNEDNGAGPCAGFDVTINCQKQGSDYKLPVEQIILANQVQSVTEKNNKTMGCLVSYVGGVPTVDTDSGLCSSWIGSIDDTSIGLSNINLKAGICTKSPVCNLTTTGNGQCASFNGVEPTANDINVLVATCGGAAVDGNYQIDCKCI